MAWYFNQHEPVFLQIANRLRADILCGKYEPDAQIPSVRQLASEAAVNPNTMQRALSQLEEERILHSHGTLGRFVTSDTEILDRARDEMRRRTVRAWLEEAKYLNIPTEKIIQYIKEEEGKV